MRPSIVRCNGNITALFHHRECQGPDNIERSHQNNQSDGNEDGQLFQFECRKQGAVQLNPGIGNIPRTDQCLDSDGHTGRLFNVLNSQFQGRDFIGGKPQEVLSGRNRYQSPIGANSCRGDEGRAIASGKNATDSKLPSDRRLRFGSLGI